MSRLWNTFDLGESIVDRRDRIQALTGCEEQLAFDVAVAQQQVARCLRTFCAMSHLQDDSPLPTYEELKKSLLLVFRRLGWAWIGHDQEVERLDAMIVALSFVTEDAGWKYGFAKNETLHKQIACCELLGWVQTDWALNPAPWPTSIGVMHSASSSSICTPKGWVRETPMQVEVIGKLKGGE